MFLPIGHDSGTVRRNPWVTYMIMAACVGIFFVTNSTSGDIARDYSTKLHDAIQYFVEHPYLVPPTELEPVLGPHWQEERRALLEMRQRAGAPTPPAFLRSEEQAELDEKVRAAFAVRSAHPFFHWGLVSGDPTLRGAFGYMFLHGGWMHLLGNMLLLFLTAPFIEDKWGRPLFLGFFLLAGLAGAGLFMSRFPELDTPLIGASGAVAGCMGAFLVRFWKAKLRYLVWLGIIVFTFSAPAWLMLPLWVGMEYALARFTESLNPMGGGSVAHWAHVGGFVFGVCVAGALRALKIEERWMDAVVDRKIGTVDNADVESAMQAMEEGRAEDAFGALQRLVRQDPKNREAAQAYWDAAVAVGRAAEAAPVLLRLIRDEVRGGEIELAVQHWMEFSQRAEALPVDPVLALRLAPELAAQEHRGLAAEVLRRGLASPEATPTVCLRLARAAVDMEPALAADGARRVLDQGSPEEKAEAQRLLDELGDMASSGPPSLELPDPDPGPELPSEEGDTPALSELAEEAPGQAPLPAEAATLSEVEDLDGLDLDGIDLDGLGLESDPARDFSDPSLDEPGPEERPVGPAETLPGGPPEPAAAPPGALDPDPHAGLEPGTLDPDALSAEAQPEAAASSGFDDWGNIQFEDASEPGAPVLRPLRVMEAVPLKLRDDSIALEVEGRGKTRLRFERVDAVAAAAVRLPGRERPVLLVDLALNFGAGAGSPLQIVRLRSDRFDPRRLVEGNPKPLAALRQLVATLLERSAGMGLPDRGTACGDPRFAMHASLSAYEHDVLLADSTL